MWEKLQKFPTFRPQNYYFFLKRANNGTTSKLYFSKLNNGMAYYSFYRGIKDTKNFWDNKI